MEHFITMLLYTLHICFHMTQIFQVAKNCFPSMWLNSIAVFVYPSFPSLTSVEVTKQSDCLCIENSNVCTFICAALAVYARSPAAYNSP